MELNAERAINELDYQTKFAKFTKCTGVYISAKCAQFALDNIKVYEQRIKELTAKTETQDIIIKELRQLLEKANHDADRYALKIKELTAEYDSMAKSVNEASDLIRKLRADKKQLTEENERLRAEGKWKKVSEKAPRYVCTSCNHLYNNKEYKHCPNCGAKMQGE